MSTAAQQNPFSTCFTRPGEIPFLFGDASELKLLVSAFVDHGWVGQIVGPHGCGKTTLCHMLAIELGSVFQVVNHVTIRSGRDVKAMRFENSERCLTGKMPIPRKPSESTKQSEPTEPSVPKLTIVDGVERLSLLQQRMMINNLKRKTDQAIQADGLLITSHRQLKFVPVLRRITPSLAAFESVVRYLDPSLEINQNELAELFGQSRDNIREAIMLLYDRHESFSRFGC